MVSMLDVTGTATTVYGTRAVLPDPRAADPSDSCPAPADDAMRKPPHPDLGVTTTVSYVDESGPPALTPEVSGWHAFLLRKAVRRLTGTAEHVLGPTGLTLRHFAVLSVVEAKPGQNQRVVGESLHIDRTTVVALADDLERLGLLERRRGVDRRTFALHLTPAGVGRLEELTGMVGKVHEGFLSTLTASEQETLRELLIKLTAD